MSSGKKLCCYKNCDQDPNCTFFKFPIEKDRFYGEEALKSGNFRNFKKYQF